VLFLEATNRRKEKEAILEKIVAENFPVLGEKCIFRLTVLTEHQEVK
jgi:hypothetical protein